MDQSLINAYLIGLVAFLTSCLIGLLAWIGKGALTRLDTVTGLAQEMVAHLTTLNHRTEKLEGRMTTQEER